MRFQAPFIVSPVFFAALPARLPVVAAADVTGFSSARGCVLCAALIARSLASAACILARVAAAFACFALSFDDEALFRAVKPAMAPVRRSRASPTLDPRLDAKPRGCSLA